MRVPCPALDVMTLDKLADREAIEQLVGYDPDLRYKRAGLFLPGPDGMSRFDYFSRKPEERVAELQRRILLREPWHRAYQVEIPKEPYTEEHRLTETYPATRPITYTTVLDAGLLYRLHDWLVGLAETRLNEVAIAYRPQRSMTASIRAAMSTIRENRLFTISVIDIRSFYDSLSWKRLQGVVESLPADQDVKALLHELVEIEVVDRKTGKVVPRCRGIAQGLNVSPVVANLFMSEFDHWVMKKLRRLGAVVRRYADDIAIFAPSIKAACEARKIVFGHIERLGLQVKEGTGGIVDLLPDPEPGLHRDLNRQGDHLHLSPGVTWLGLQFSTGSLEDRRRVLLVDVDPSKSAKKAHEIQAEFDLGFLSRDGVQDRLEGLKRFYRLTLSEVIAQEVIDNIKKSLNLGKPDQRAVLEEVEGKEEENGNGKLDPRERRTGGQDLVCRLSEMEIPDEERGNRGRWSKPFLHRARRSGGDVSSGVLGDSIFLEVPRRGGHRPRSPGAPTGTRSAAPMPGGIENVVTVRVRPRGPTRADVVVDGGYRNRFAVSNSESLSVPEVYVLAATRAFESLNAPEQPVLLVVTDPTLAGVLWEGWETCSVPLARALVGFWREAKRLDVRFERGVVPRRRERTDGSWPWT